MRAIGANKSHGLDLHRAVVLKGWSFMHAIEAIMRIPPICV
jgi:hypothetical protein